MYKVVLVDDEINILRGIATLVDWGKYDTKLVAEMYHGKMALDYVENDIPDIVITDIKMPGMNGIELIKRIYAKYDHVKFIILSGYDEFEFAKTAMAYNVKHYLLKPSNEQKIEKALSEVVEELNEQKRRQNFIASIHQRLEKIIPKAKEQILKEYLTNKKYGLQEWEYYQSMLDMDEMNVSLRLLVFITEDAYEYEHLFALQEIMMNELKKKKLFFHSTMIGEKIVIILESVQTDELIEHLKYVQNDFMKIYQRTFTVGISSSGYIQDARELYHEALNGLSKRFHLGAGSIIVNGELGMEQSTESSFQYDHDDLIHKIRSGDVTSVCHYINDFFLYLQGKLYEEHIVRSHSLELLLTVIRQAKKDEMELLLTDVFEITQMSTMEQIREYLIEIAEQVTQQHFIDTKQIQSTIIKKVIEYIDLNLNDEELSLSKIASEVAYMNPDYFGKLFKKEMGEKFSSYLLKQRVKKAIELIEQNEEVKMFEVAEQVGLGNNPRYFSQLFKKQTGYTPTEYRQEHSVLKITKE